MAIYLFDGSKYQPLKWTSSEELIIKLELDYIHESEGIDRQIRKGNHVYCFLRPRPISARARDLYWGTNMDKVRESYLSLLRDC